MDGRGDAPPVFVPRQLIPLRRRVLDNPPAAYAEHRAAIGEICAYFRSCRDEVLPANAGLMARLEYRFITAGSRRGFELSRIVDHLARNPDSFLWGMKIPDMPAY